MFFNELIHHNKLCSAKEKACNMQFLDVIYRVNEGVINKIDRFVSGELVFELNSNKLDKELKCFFFFLKKSMLMRMVFLYDVTAVDLLDMPYRFLLYYNLLSVLYNFRIFVKLLIYWGRQFPYTKGIFSLTFLYNSAAWLEREVWDMFGIIFRGHNDLRRILTDYGFSGFPLRKDFPVVGFYEVRYDDNKKIVVYEKVRLSQEYRVFSFINPWY
jgi:NADH-quinone oxidoreductase subunit C